MKILEAFSSDGVTQTSFEIELEAQQVPGLRWCPTASSGPLPTVLIGHGGFQSKEAPNIVEMAQQFAREFGWASIALDAPGHGARRSAAEIKAQEETLRRLRSEGVNPQLRQQRDQVVSSATQQRPADQRPPRMVREWQALLDHLQADPALAASSYGYWGVSMGTRYGIPLVARETRIKAAVLGLFGLMPDPAFKQTVASIQLPLLFLFQYHDELMTPDAGLALWDAFGSKEKTMHINPGPHVGIPKFERDASADFFARHLQ